MIQVWRAMEAEVTRGSVLALGISNCYALPTLQKLWSEATVKPRVLQNRFPPKTPPPDQRCPALNPKPHILLQGSTKTLRMTATFAPGARRRE
jgi:diketogulonate reductase-like aldo/keto reductase